MQPPGRPHPADAPPPTPIPDWAAAEQNATRWLRWLGHDDAQRTPDGADQGLDVTGTDVAAQVKWYGTKIGVPRVRELVGAATGTAARLYFFCNAGFTRDAVAFADRAAVALFRYSPADGSIEAVNPTARHAYAAALRRRTSPDAAARNSGPARDWFRSLRTPPDQPPHPAARRAALATILAPAVMGVVAILAVIVARRADDPPEWLGRIWAGWMCLTCLSPFLAGGTAALWGRRRLDG
ncbi:hypothetical protein Ait01nite_014890 [Actinoplanes italicus]|uniref:Restriction endonuclease n=1 Tax=Actinoplanes italicus TaxID=113567 RepID=A0A2T0KHJ8_9ACTN|nr:restriction endonuclease [Actinoplanes italicus]PRX22923.1 restriction endonuclease [Actinoplanes italicus]GIE28444.1 hypothetical protein Ait01nite_014890 [Actinoplanes italicus]